MSIERPNMAEGTQGSGPEGQGPTPPIAPAGEPKVTVAPEAKSGRFSRWFRKEPKPQVLVEPGEQVTPAVTAPEVSTDQPSEPVSPSDQEPPTRGLGGSGNGNGSSEGPRGPEPPEIDWGFPENIWGPEFRERGTRIARDIVVLESLPYQQKYSDENIIIIDGQRKYKLDYYYEEWRAWVAEDGRRSSERKPFLFEIEDFPREDEPEAPPIELTEDEKGVGMTEEEKAHGLTVEDKRHGVTIEAKARDEMLRKVFWAPYYGDYFTITANTEKEFGIAVSTFTHWVITGLGKSPDEISRKVMGFITELTARGNARVIISENWPVEKRVTSEFILGLKQELEALIGVYGADWANERYNAKDLQGFLGFLVKDEGTKRFNRLSRLYNGKVAAALWKLDNDPRFELLFSPHGSRGQLMRERDGVAQRELIKQIEASLIAEIMGVRIKEYHPHDSKKRIISQFREDNLKDISRFQSEESFKNLFEGFDLETQTDQRVRSIQEGLKKGKVISKIIDELTSGFTGEQKDKEIKEIKKIYEEADTAFKLAYQLYGMMGEKAIRSGGVFLVEREVGNQKFFDYVPVHWAEKFVQFAVNFTKAKYADKPADFVQIAADKAMERAIDNLRGDGFDAKLSDVDIAKQQDGSDDVQYKEPITHNKQTDKLLLTPQLEVARERDDPKGNPLIRWGGEKFMKLKVPKLRNRTSYQEQNIKKLEDRYEKKADGSIDTEEVEVDFQTVIRELAQHPYSNWTSHAYWGYQEEDTGEFLKKRAFDDARKIKAGILRPEDASPHARQLLTVDPTLERVGYFFYREGREDKITLAAVEDSYQTHWEITDKLYMKFYPENADDENNRVAYVLQDQGGSTKQWFHIRAEAARWTDARMRRLRTLIPVLPLHFSSMSEMWGAGSALNVMRMMAYEQYGMVGQFALQKWVAQTGGAQDIYDALNGFVSEQEKRSREGLGEKPTNDADALTKFIKTLKGTFYKTGEYDPNAGAEDADNEFLNGVRESLGRLEALCQRVRVEETDYRGERAPLWLKGIDIYERRPDGNIKIVNGQKVFNREIDKNRDAGSSRHSLKRFFWKYIRWLRSEMEEEGQGQEGQALYPNVALFYAFMDKYTYASMRAVKEGRPGAKLETRWEWLLGKIVR